jgi:hypothetical protein
MEPTTNEPVTTPLEIVHTGVEITAGVGLDSTHEVSPKLNFTPPEVTLTVTPTGPDPGVRTIVG